MDLNSTFGHGLDMLSSGWSVGAVDVNERRLCSSCCQARAHEADEAHWCQVKIVRGNIPVLAHHAPLAMRLVFTSTVSPRRQATVAIGTGVGHSNKECGGKTQGSVQEMYPTVQILKKGTVYGVSFPSLGCCCNFIARGGEMTVLG